MKRRSVLTVVALILLNATHLLAQDDKNKKNDDEAPTPVYNYVIDDPMDQFNQPKAAESPIRYFLFPEFFSYWPIDNNDTTLKYECYDINHALINTDTLHDMGDVQFISFIKRYTDYTHTYVDEDGKPMPLPIANILYKYERTGTNEWKGYDYQNKYTSDLKEFKNNIVRYDTTYITNPASGSRQLTVRKYYKVGEIIQPNEIAPEIAITGPKNGPPAFVYYTVPEFYFHAPKKNKDTTIEFLCYNEEDSLMHGFTDFDSVRYLSLYKSYTDSAHTYIDKEGQKQLLPVSSIIQRYDRIGKDKWMSIEYPSNKYMELKEFKSVIVNTDTETLTDPVTGNEVQYIYNHYKVIK